MDSDVISPAKASSYNESWSSGRILSPAQRARKREVNKLASRRRRQEEKDKTEQLQKELQEARSFLDSALKWKSQEAFLDGDLGPKLEDLESGRALIPASTAPLLQLEAPVYILDSPPDSQHLTNPIDPIGEASVRSLSSASSSYPFDTLSISIDENLDLNPFDDNSDPLYSLITGEPVSPNQSLSHGESTTIFDSFEILLQQAHRLRPHQICLDDQANQNALISAIVLGWDTVIVHGLTCPLWEVLHQVDDTQFYVASITTRLTMLRTIHTMLISQVMGDNYRQLPPWYRPRPVQRKFQHEVTKGYFAWPGLRERLVISDDTILTNAFFDAFARSFQLHWSHGDADTYFIDPSTGEFRFSGIFMNHIHHIHSWRMDYSFFGKYPALYEDIEPVEPVIPLVNLAASKSQLKLIQDVAQSETSRERGFQELSELPPTT